MRIICTALLILISNVLFAQLSGNLGIGYNRYSNSMKEFKRTNGLTLQLGLEKSLTSRLSLIYGMNFSIANENYYDFHYATYYDQMTDKILTDFSHRITNKYTNYSLSFQYPFGLKTEILEGKLFLLTGISLNIDNFAAFGGNYIGELDPEVNLPNDETWPQTRLFGFGHQIGLQYYSGDKFGIYTEWKSTTNSKFGFSYFEAGLIFSIFTNK